MEMHSCTRNTHYAGCEGTRPIDGTWLDGSKTTESPQCYTKQVAVRAKGFAQQRVFAQGKYLGMMKDGRFQPIGTKLNIDKELEIRGTGRYKKPAMRPTAPVIENFKDGTDAVVMTTRRKELRQWRDCVLYDWDGRSGLTGGTLLLHVCHLVDRSLLTDEERMDTSQGVLLESCYNEAMYQRLAWFEDDGTLVLKPGREKELELAGLRPGKLSRVTPEMVPHFKRHRDICLEAA